LGAFVEVNPRRWTTVPPFKGHRRDELSRIFEESHLKRGSEGEAYDATYPAGVVSDQKPEAGQTVERGSQVSLTFSRGAAPVTSAPAEQVTAIPPGKPSPREDREPEGVPTKPRPKPTMRPATPYPTAKESPTSGAGSGGSGGSIPTAIILVAAAAAVGLLTLVYKILKRPGPDRPDRHEVAANLEVRPVRNDGRQRLLGKPPNATRVGIAIHPDPGRTVVRFHRSGSTEKEGER